MNHLKRLLILFMFLLFLSIGVYGETQIKSCQNVDISGEYYINQSIGTKNIDTSTCFNIEVDNVIIDCRQNSIINVNSRVHSGFVANNHNNITIKNCNIERFDEGLRLGNSQKNNFINITFKDLEEGIYMNNVENSNFSNIDFTDTDEGVELDNSDNNIFVNISFYDMAEEGIELGNSDNNIFQDIKFEYMEEGVELDNSDNNIFQDMSFIDMDEGFYLHYSHNNMFKNMTFIEIEEGITMYEVHNNNFIDLNFNEAEEAFYIGWNTYSNLFENISIDSDDYYDLHFENAKSCYNNNFTNIRTEENKAIEIIKDTVNIDGGEYDSIFLCNISSGFIKNLEFRKSRANIYLYDVENVDFDNLTFDNSKYTIVTESGSNENLKFNNIDINLSNFDMQLGKGSQFTNSVFTFYSKLDLLVLGEDVKLENISFVDSNLYIKDMLECDTKFKNVTNDGVYIDFFNSKVDLNNLVGDSLKIILCNADNSYIQNGVFENTFSPIQVFNTDNLMIDNVSIKYNAGEAITIHNSDNVIINNSQITGGSVGIIMKDVNNSIISNSRISNIYTGINFFNSVNNKILNNIISQSHYPLRIEFSDDNKFLFNDFFLSNNMNFYLLDSDNLLFIGNIFGAGEFRTKYSSNINFNGSYNGNNIGNYWYDMDCEENKEIGDFKVCTSPNKYEFNSLYYDEAFTDYAPLDYGNDNNYDYEVTVDSCQNIYEYDGARKIRIKLENDIYMDNYLFACFKFYETSNITFDCQGHNIIGRPVSFTDKYYFSQTPYAFYSQGGNTNNNIEIKNCNIDNFREAFNLKGNNFLIENVSVKNVRNVFNILDETNTSELKNIKFSNVTEFVPLDDNIFRIKFTNVTQIGTNKSIKFYNQTTLDIGDLKNNYVSIFYNMDNIDLKDLDFENSSLYLSNITNSDLSDINIKDGWIGIDNVKNTNFNNLKINYKNTYGTKDLILRESNLNKFTNFSIYISSLYDEFNKNKYFKSALRFKKSSNNDLINFSINNREDYITKQFKIDFEESFNNNLSYFVINSNSNLFDINKVSDCSNNINNLLLINNESNKDKYEKVFFVNQFNNFNVSQGSLFSQIYFCDIQSNIENLELESNKILFYNISDMSISNLTINSSLVLFRNSNNINVENISLSNNRTQFRLINTNNSNISNVTNGHYFMADSSYASNYLNLNFFAFILGGRYSLDNKIFNSVFDVLYVDESKNTTIYNNKYDELILDEIMPEDIHFNYIVDGVNVGNYWSDFICDNYEKQGKYYVCTSPNSYTFRYDAEDYVDYAPLVDVTKIPAKLNLSLNNDTVYNLRRLEISFIANFSKNISEFKYEINNRTVDISSQLNNNVNNKFKIRLPHYNINNITFYFRDLDGILAKKSIIIFANLSLPSKLNDLDGDGINDSDDSIKGNMSNLNTGLNLSLEIGGQTNLNQIFNETKFIQFKKNKDKFLEFRKNLFNSSIDLTNITIIEEDSLNKTKVLIRGVELEGNETKTIYFKLIGNITKDSSLCIKDSELFSFDEISSGCNQDNEYYISQVPYNSNNLMVTYENKTSGLLKIEGLKHSGIKQVCTENWQYGVWSSCSNDVKIRTAVDLNNCGTKNLKQSLTLSCDSGSNNDNHRGSSDDDDDDDGSANYVSSSNLDSVDEKIKNVIDNNQPVKKNIGYSKNNNVELINAKYSIPKNIQQGFSIKVGGKNLTLQKYSGINKVSIENKNFKIIYEYDFENELNYTNLNISYLSNNDSNYIIIRNLNIDDKKTIIMKSKFKANQLCVKDAEVNSINEITKKCNGESEFLVNCDNQEKNGYICHKIEDEYIVYGLSHSGVYEVKDKINQDNKFRIYDINNIKSLLKGIYDFKFIVFAVVLIFVLCIVLFVRSKNNR